MNRSTEAQGCNMLHCNALMRAHAPSGSPASDNEALSSLVSCWGCDIVMWPDEAFNLCIYLSLAACHSTFHEAAPARAQNPQQPSSNEQLVANPKPMLKTSDQVLVPKACASQTRITQREGRCKANDMTGCESCYTPASRPEVIRHVAHMS